MKMTYRKICLKLMLPIWLLFCAIVIRACFLASHSHYTPDYSKIKLADYLNKDSLSEQDYLTLYRQTGLAPAAIDSIWQKENALSLLTIHQTNYLSSVRLSSTEYVWATQRKEVVDEDGDPIEAFSLADVENGDIILTFSSYTSGYSHGHVGIVTDAEKGTVLEAITPGNPSECCDISHWYSYATCLQLRLTPDAAVNCNCGARHQADTGNTNYGQLRDAIASYAATYLNDRSYTLLAGITSKKETAFDTDTSAGTQCAHLVWSAFHAFGYDIDANGGMLVTVSDIAKSPLLSVVQIYGLNTDDYPFS